MLTSDNVRVYDLADARARLIGKITLPNWSVVHELCDPDMVLDGTGSAVIVSNVNPRPWLIDGYNFALTTRDIRLHQKEQWDTGFRALAFAADGMLIAWTSAGDSLWKIDPATAKGHRIDLAAPPAVSCGFPAQWLDGFERSLQP